MADHSLTIVRKQIDELLYENRPDRYDVRSSGDTEVDAEWLDTVADKVAADLDIEDVLKQFSRNLVRQREGRATRSANKVLRQFAQDGQLMLGWWEQERQPVAIVTRTQKPGRDPEIREERVALGALTAKDLLAFANEERVRAGRDFAARNATCDGAELMAQQILKGRFPHLSDWGQSVAPREDAA